MSGANDEITDLIDFDPQNFLSPDDTLFIENKVEAGHEYAIKDFSDIAFENYSDDIIPMHEHERDVIPNARDKVPRDELPAFPSVEIFSEAEISRILSMNPEFRIIEADPYEYKNDPPIQKYTRILHNPIRTSVFHKPMDQDIDFPHFSNIEKSLPNTNFYSGNFPEIDNTHNISDYRYVSPPFGIRVDLVPELKMYQTYSMQQPVDFINPLALSNIIPGTSPIIEQSYENSTTQSIVTVENTIQENFTDIACTNPDTNSEYLPDFPITKYSTIGLLAVLEFVIIEKKVIGVKVNKSSSSEMLRPQAKFELLKVNCLKSLTTFNEKQNIRFVIEDIPFFLAIRYQYPSYINIIQESTRAQSCKAYYNLFVEINTSKKQIEISEIIPRFYFNPEKCLLVHHVLRRMSRFIYKTYRIREHSIKNRRKILFGHDAIFSTYAQNQLSSFLQSDKLHKLIKNINTKYPADICDNTEPSCTLPTVENQKKIYRIIEKILKFSRMMNRLRSVEDTPGNFKSAISRFTEIQDVFERDLLIFKDVVGFTILQCEVCSVYLCIFEKCVPYLKSITDML